MIRQFTRACSTKLLPKSSDVVVIGGGVIGLSTAYHLIQLGYKNVCVIERHDITSGTTWHSNGIVWRLRPSESDVQLLARTHQLVTEELLSKQGVETTGWINNGGLFLAHNQQRIQEYQRLHGLSKYYGIESHMLDRNQVIDFLKPLIDKKTTDLVGGLYSPRDGFADPYQYCTALVKGGQLNVFNNCSLIAINTNDCIGSDIKNKRINSVCVQYDNDIHQINTGIVVNSTGCWAPIVARLAGISNLPQETMEHAFITTESIEGVDPIKTPNIRDHDLSIAFRVSGNSFCIGGYEPDPELISHKIESLSPYTLFELNWDKFGINMENSIKLMPVLATTGIKQVICGPESFTPDHRPLLGEDPVVKGFFHASAFNSFGINLSGGVGQQLAKWMAFGSPDFDLSAYDINRFNKHLINNKVWSHMRCREAYAGNYGIIYQRDEPQTARNQTFRDGLYETLVSKGCVYSERHGIQTPDWFDLEPDRLSQKQYIDLDKSYDWPENSRQCIAVKNECKAVHEGAVIFNLSSMAKFSLKGENALQVIDSLTPINLKSMKNNSTIFSYLLNRRGGIDSDVVIIKVNDNDWYITCVDFNTNRVFTKIKDLIINKMIENTKLLDLSQRMSILSINGPKSTQLLEKCFNISLNEFEDNTHRKIQLNINQKVIDLRLIRTSLITSIGWELHMDNDTDLKTIYCQLIDNEMATNGGLRAYESLKNDNNLLSAGIDLRCDDLLSDIGLDSDICVNKLESNSFIGSEALKSNENRFNRKHFVWIKLEKKSPVVWGLEPIWHNSQIIGLVRKSFYSHSCQQMLGLGIIFDQFLDNSKVPSNFDIEIFGQSYSADCQTIPTKKLRKEADN